MFQVCGCRADIACTNSLRATLSTGAPVQGMLGEKYKTKNGIRSSQEQPISTWKCVLAVLAHEELSSLKSSPTWQVYNIRIGHTSVYNFLQCLAGMPEASQITYHKSTKSK